MPGKPPGGVPTSHLSATCDRARLSAAAADLTSSRIVTYQLTGDTTLDEGEDCHPIWKMVLLLTAATALGADEDCQQTSAFYAAAPAAHALAASGCLASGVRPCMASQAVHHAPCLSGVRLQAERLLAHRSQLVTAFFCSHLLQQVTLLACFCNMALHVMKHSAQTQYVSCG